LVVMKTSFQFATAANIVFGPGSVEQVAPAAAEMGRRALVVTGNTQGRAARLVKDLSAKGISSCLFAVDGEPTIPAVRAGVERGRAENCDVVISFGGGSPIDAGKAIAAILGNGGDPLDYIEVVGRGQKIQAPSLPFIAVPTTAGTGSEVTRNAVLASPEHKVKASLRSPSMLPRLAVVDPDLTLDLPAAITAATGLDALTQLIEPYVSAKANAMTDTFCLEVIRRAASALPRLCTNLSDREARTGMAMASLLGGLALANAGLGVVHGFAAPLGGMFPAPHGAVCAALLPHGMEMNLHALSARQTDGEPLRRYGTIARILTGNDQATAHDGVEWVRDLVRRFGIPGLGTYGLTASNVPEVVEKASQASSMKANPVVLTSEELTAVLLAAINTE
jgi:alcohol dehydrogenase class IV